MKALSPAGAKIQPMLAIATQGVLYSIGVGVFGVSTPGVAFGMALLSVWAFVQPLLFAGALFGAKFFEAVESAWIGVAQWIGNPERLGIGIIVGAVVTKAIAAIVVGIVAWLSGARSGNRFEAIYFERTKKWQEKWIPRGFSPATLSGTQSPMISALLDLMNPWFLLSFAFSAAFVAATGGGKATWLYLARTITVSGLLFYFVRRFQPNLARWMLQTVTTPANQTDSDTDSVSDAP
jgi:hypothetical protein